MKSSEKILAIVLILVMAGAAGGVGFWQLIYNPYRKHQSDIANLRKEIDALETEKQEVELAAFVYETKTKKKSLPSDITFSRKEYSRLLSNMLRKAEFDSTDIKITAKDPNTTQVPTLAPKKPAYTKLEFDVTVKGDLTSVVDFLYHFYRQPLLHQITKITLVKPSGGRGRGGDLDMTLLVQAIVLDRAEDRSVLLATVPSITLMGGGATSSAYSKHSVDIGLGNPFVSMDVLARAGNAAAYQNSTPLQEYRRIAGKNIFYGPAPSITPKKKEEREEQPEEKRVKEIDLSPFVALIQVSHGNDGSATAVVYDRYNKHYYEIEQEPKGGVRILKFWYATKEENGQVYEVKKKFSDDDYDYRFLTFGREETGNERAFRVKRILESDIVIEPYSAERGKLMKGPATAIMGGTASLALPGTLFSWHIGQILRSEEEGRAPVSLKTSEARNTLLRPLNFEGVSGESLVVPELKKPDMGKKRPGL